MKLLSLSVLITTALAAVQQKCVSFEKSPENSSHQSSINIKVERDTSLLLFNFDDLKTTNIPFSGVTQDLIQSEKDGFTVCSQKHLSSGYCDELGLFTVKGKLDETDDSIIPDDIVNKYALTGDEVSYNITKQGIYCYVAYQDAGKPNVEGVEVEYVHSYGKLPLDQYSELITQGYLLLLNTFAIIGFKLYFRSITKSTGVSSLSIPHDFIWKLWWVDVLSSEFQFFWLMVANILGSYDGVIKGFIELVQLFKSLAIYYLFFGFSLNEKIVGESGYNFKRLRDFGSNYSKQFHSLLLALTISRFITDVLQFSSVDGVSITLGIFNSFVWVPIFYIYEQNFKLVSQDILDLPYLKSFKKSRKVVISIPILLSLISPIYLTVESFIQTKNTFESGNLDNVKYSDALIDSLDLTTGLTSLLVQKVGSFKYFLIGVVLFIIWRPKPVESTSVGAVSLDEGEISNDADESKIREKA